MCSPTRPWPPGVPLLVLTLAWLAGRPGRAEPPPAPEATVMRFREMFIGNVPGAGRRHTWTITTRGTEVALTLELEATGRGSEEPILRNLDARSLDPIHWKPLGSIRFSGTGWPGTVRLTRQGWSGPLAGPPEISLACGPRTVDVHPAHARLVAGRIPGNGEGYAPTWWAPRRTERVQAIACSLDPDKDLLIRFRSKGEASLYFAPARPGRRGGHEGLEWASIHKDMSSEGEGFRFIPGASGTSPR